MKPAEQLTLLPEASRDCASPSLLPGSAAAKAMTVGSGLKCAALLRSANPVGCLVRTLLESSVWASTACWLIWKPSATKSGRLLFRLARSERGINGNGSGLLPTLTVGGGGNRCELTPYKGHFLRPSGKKAHLGLDQVMRMLPTLTVNGNHNRAGLSPTSGDGLATALKRLMPTVTASDTGHRTTRYAQGGTPLSMEIGGPLNPEWCEWYMGYPIKWTELEPSATPSSPRLRTN